MRTVHDEPEIVVIYVRLCAIRYGSLRGRDLGVDVLGILVGRDLPLHQLLVLRLEFALENVRLRIEVGVQVVLAGLDVLSH